ncbi:MAG: DUF4870 domain-containing protein [Candidatus Woesearchaeota archaeon]
MRSRINSEDDSKLFAFLGILLMIVGYILIYFTRKNDRYAMHYAKQGLVIFIAVIVAMIAGWIFKFIPVIGELIQTVLWAIVLALWVVGLIYSLSGEKKEIPLIGELARKF